LDGRLRVGFGNADGKETRVMKTFTVAAVMLTLIAMPAQAQMKAKQHRPDENQVDQKQKKIDEKAYKAALERIPEPKEKYDPWGVARPAEPAKKPK
jgi:fructoselysine-6-P-deglycase FrlB-like protein